MSDYKQTRDAAGKVTTQYDKMLRNLDDDLVKQALAELGDVVRCRCSEAYTVCGRRDPDCQCDSAEAVKVVAERIQKLEAKLEALDHAYDHLVQALRFEALRTDDAEAKLKHQTYLIEQLFHLLDKREETDDGRIFHPNQLRSCRAADTEKLSKILAELRSPMKGQNDD